MDQFKSILTKMLDYLGFLNDDQKLSLTNIAVIVFIVITAFRSLFGGAVFTFSDFKWQVEVIDMASTLPLLFALINYGHKRIANNNTSSRKEDKTNG